MKLRRSERLALWLLLTMGLCGCPSPRVVTKVVVVNAAVPNTFERCKGECAIGLKGPPAYAVEDEDGYRCACKPYTP